MDSTALRIAILGKYPVEGQSNNLTRASTEIFAQLGHRLHVVPIPMSPSHGSLAKAYVPSPNVTFHAPPWNYYGQRLLWAANLPRFLARLVREHRVDILFVHYLLHAPLAYASVRSAGVPVVGWAWGDDVRTLPWSRRPLAAAVRWAVPRLDLVVCPHPELDPYLERLAVPRQKILRTTHSVDTEVFRPTREVDGHAALLVARLHPLKGQEFAIDALAAGEGWDLVLVGDGPDRARLEERATRLGVASRVRFVGECGDVRPYLEAAQVILVLGKEVNIWSATLLEAMACGKAIVATDVADTRKHLEGLVHLVPYGDASALAAAISRLLQRPAEREHLGARARQFAMTHLDAKTNYRALVQQMVGKLDGAAP